MFKYFLLPVYKTKSSQENLIKDDKKVLKPYGPWQISI